jgi:hypothetical protein
MGDYYNDELRHRQRTGDVGHAVLGNIDSARSGRRWKALLFPLAVLAVGVLLMYVGPLPGLGLMLCVGGVVALPIIAIQAFLSP